MHAILCAGYYTLHCIQQTWKQAARCTSLHPPKYTPDCTRLHTPSQLDCTPQSKLSRCSEAHSQARSQLPIALDDTLPACLTIRSPVISQEAPNYTLSTLPSTPPSTISVHSWACSQGRFQLHTMAPSQPTWLYSPSKLSRRSQAHSRAHSQVHSQSHLTISFHVCSRVLHPEIWWVAGARHREAGGGWRVVGGGWRVAGGGWRVVGGIWWPKSWRQ